MKGLFVRLSLVVIAGAALLVSTSRATAQNAAHASIELASVAAVSSWLAYDAPPGEEFHITDAVMAADSHWHRDELGNLVVTVGSGRPRRLIACGLDHVGFVVSDITDQGYLRLRRAGNGVTHPLWDQFHQAQQVRVLTARGSIPGVVAVDNLHFAAEHRGDTSVVNVDQLWVDIGVRSRAEATALGVTLINPVVRDVPAWIYADYVAGPDASGRAGCAAVASVARAAQRNARNSGETVFVLSAQSSFRWSGLEGAVARLGKFDEATIVTAASPSGDDTAAVSRSPFPPRSRSTPVVNADSISRIVVRARFAGSLMESVRARDLDSLLMTVRAAAHVSSSAPWIMLSQTSTIGAKRTRDSLSVAADVLTRLVELPAVGEREAPVRDAIRSAMPAWARKQVVQDSAGDLILSMGPDRDTSVFLAHMDEVGYIVQSMDRDGTVTLTPQGGLNGAAWEGQPALLYPDRPTNNSPNSVSPASLAGVFVPREHAKLRRPDVMHAWFGMDSAALVAHGVHPGLVVTAYKRGERLAATRFTARALDDRAGDTALLLALADLDPAKLNHKVIFVWSVEEEVGLFGAAAVARSIGTSVHHAYAIDTFVSSDTPLESPLFAFAPLGDGPVLRASDDGMIMLPSERDRIISVARSSRIPLQVGTTKGSTDAGPFVAKGAIGAQLGWPGRYSHSPAEVLDLNDLKALARIVRALAQ
jgi:putative aminopeptidase FrvX